MLWASKKLTILFLVFLQGCGAATEITGLSWDKVSGRDETSDAGDDETSAKDNESSLEEDGETRSEGEKEPVPGTEGETQPPADGADTFWFTPFPGLAPTKPTWTKDLQTAENWGTLLDDLDVFMFYSSVFYTGGIKAADVENLKNFRELLAAHGVKVALEVTGARGNWTNGDCLREDFGEASATQEVTSVKLWTDPYPAGAGGTFDYIVFDTPFRYGSSRDYQSYCEGTMKELSNSQHDDMINEILDAFVIWHERFPNANLGFHTAPALYEVSHAGVTYTAFDAFLISGEYRPVKLTDIMTDLRGRADTIDKGMSSMINTFLMDIGWFWVHQEGLKNYPSSTRWKAPTGDWLDYGLALGAAKTLKDTGFKTVGYTDSASNAPSGDVVTARAHHHYDVMGLLTQDLTNIDSLVVQNYEDLPPTLGNVSDPQTEIGMTREIIQDIVGDRLD